MSSWLRSPFYSSALLCLVAQSCPTLQPHGLQPTGSSVHGDSPGKNIGVGCHSLLQGIFPTQGSNLQSRIAGGFFTIWATREAQTGVGSLSLLQGNFLTHELNQGLLHCRRILYQLSYPESSFILDHIINDKIIEVTISPLWPLWFKIIFGKASLLVQP